MFAKSALSAAVDLEESVNAVNTIFGESSGIIKTWGENAAQQAGLSQSSFQQMAAETGNAWAQYRLGESFRMGAGVEKDLEQAALWYLKAARQGNEFAEARLVDMSENRY